MANLTVAGDYEESTATAHSWRAGVLIWSQGNCTNAIDLPADTDITAWLTARVAASDERLAAEYAALPVGEEV